MALVLTIVRFPEGSFVPDLRKVFGPDGGTLGRSADNTWQLPDPKRLVSASHASIRATGDSYFLTDNSTNGVYVNEGKRPLGAGNQVRLSQGDHIYMGDYELVVEFVPGPPPAASPRGSGVHALPVQAVPARPVATRAPLPPAPAYVRTGADPVAEPYAERYVAPAEPSPTFNDELMQLLGIDPTTVPADVRARFAPLVAEWIREATQGLLKALGSRNAIKNEFRINLTSIQAMDNNPLKFSPNLEEALRNMFAVRSNAYMPGPLAIRKSFQDIAMHELAMITGMHAAFEHMMSRFSPATLQDRFDKIGGKSGLLQSRKAHYWESYEQLYQEMTGNMDEAFHDLFGEEFAEVYEQYILAADFPGKK
jgi:predicted component of type VI protein secretion system